MTSLKKNVYARILKSQDGTSIFAVIVEDNWLF